MGFPSWRGGIAFEEEVWAMTSNYRKYDEDFKQGAVQLVTETGKPIAKVARIRGCPPAGRVVRLGRRCRVTGGRSAGDVLLRFDASMPSRTFPSGFSVRSSIHANRSASRKRMLPPTCNARGP